MLIERQLKLTKTYLSRRVDPVIASKRVFRKQASQDGGWLIETNLERWQWAFIEARDSLQETYPSLATVSTQVIIPARNFYVDKPSLNTLTVKGVTHDALFEDTVMKMRFVLSKTLPPHAVAAKFHRCPDESELDIMLEFIGEYLGVSELRNDLRYGTFQVAK